MVFGEETIVVSLRAITGQFRKGMESARNSVKVMNLEMKGFNQVLGLSNKAFEENYGQITKMTSRGIRLGTSIRKNTAGFRGFRMEMLGVLFFGMALANLFGGMLRPSAQLFGLFDIWSVTLQTVLLPVMSMIAPLLINLMAAFINMPEPLKILIGVFVIMGFLLGKILFIFGTLVLGVGSLIMAFGAGLLPLIGTGILIFLAVVAVITAIILIVKNWGKITEWFKGVWQTLVGVVKNVWGKIKDTLRPIGEWILNNIINPVKNFFIGLWEFVGNIFTKILDTVKQVINTAIRLVNKIPGININELSLSTDVVSQGDIKQAQSLVINQSLDLTTTANPDETRAIVREENERMLTEIRRNTV